LQPTIHEESRLVRREGPTVAIEATDEDVLVRVSEDKLGDVPARIKAAPDTINLRFDASVAPLATDELLAPGLRIDVADVLARHTDLDSDDVLAWFENLTRVGLYERTFAARVEKGPLGCRALLSSKPRTGPCGAGRGAGSRIATAATACVPPAYRS
jgi:hypothetical protein